MNEVRKLSDILNNLDTWSDKTIKQSFFGKFLNKCLKNKITINLPNAFPISIPILILSIGVLFISLSSPQFANDRFGIGIIILICFVIFLINLFSGNLKNKIKLDSIDLLILIFSFILVVSAFNSYFFKESLIGLFKYFVFFIWYFLIKITLLNSSRKTFLNLWIFLFLCATITALIGICQYIIGVEPLATWEDPNFENIHTRVYSTLGNPNLLAGYSLLILPMGIVLPFEMKINFITKILFLIGDSLILICLIFTGSRGGYLGLITGAVFSLLVILFSLIKSRNHAFSTFTFLATIIIFILAMIFLFPILQERISTIFTLREHSSNSFRINVWLACLKMLKDNWIFGIGPGNNTFRLVYGLYMLSGFDALGAYNIFLEFALEAGILGFLVFILIQLISLLKLHYLFWEKGNIFALGIFISQIALLTHGLVDTILLRPQVFVPYFFLLASIAKLESKTDN